jgi:hypothetical protein
MDVQSFWCAIESLSIGARNLSIDMPSFSICCQSVLIIDPSFFNLGKSSSLIALGFSITTQSGPRIGKRPFVVQGMK